jgi:pyridinium-3,5-biscarboxylic acid mononucleotide sulfurtransferase
MNHQLTKTTEDKHRALQEAIRMTGGVAVAYSGGVDSTLLVTVAHEVLGDRCLAVIATSSTYPARECERAVAWVKERGIPHVVIKSEELDIPEFSDNPVDRCYHCKTELFQKVREVARLHGLDSIADGSNADDASDYRPGMKAACELAVRSFLKEAGLTKSDIRVIADKVYHLDVAGKPSMACLASRFPYGSEITAEKLTQVESVEEFLVSLGFRTYRARHHDDILRLELGPDEMTALGDTELRNRITTFAKRQGFTYITVDMEGYRTGSLNETLGQTADLLVDDQ